MLNWIQINKMFFCVCCFVHTTFKNVTLACFPFTPFTSSSPHPDLQLSSPSHHHHQCLGFIRGVSNTAQSFTFPRKISESEYFINITDVTSQFNLRCIKYLSIPKKKWNESRFGRGLVYSVRSWLTCGYDVACSQLQSGKQQPITMNVMCMVWARSGPQVFCLHFVDFWHVCYLCLNEMSFKNKQYSGRHQVFLSGRLLAGGGRVVNKRSIKQLNLYSSAPIISKVSW